MAKDDMIDNIKAVMNYLYKDIGDTWYGNLLSDVLEELMNNGDFELIRHGHWEVVDETEPRRYGCSVCKKLSWTEDNYCPHCGTKMDEEKE